MLKTISVIIPAYNVEDYIKEALDSVINQHPPFNEIVIVNDGSTDKTEQIIKSYTDSRIIYHYQKNQGLGAARNKGIDLASSEYLYFMDSDDVLADDFTKVISGELQNHRDTDIDLVLFSASLINSSSQIFENSPSQYQRTSTTAPIDGPQLVRSLTNKRLFGPASACLYIFKKELLILKPKLAFLPIIHEDEAFTPSLFIRAQSAIITNRKLYLRRVRKGSIMQTPFSLKNVEGYLYAIQFWGKLAKESPAIKQTCLNQAFLRYVELICQAGRHKLNQQKTLDLIKTITPQFSKHARLDLLISGISRLMIKKVLSFRMLLNRRCKA